MISQEATEITVDTYLDLIKTKAWMFLHKFKQPSLYEFDDLINEGALVFLKCKQNYKDSMNCTFKTYLSMGISNHFTTLLHKTYKSINYDHLNQNHIGHEVPMEPISIISILSEVTSMDKEERRYLNFILGPPVEDITALAGCSKKEVLAKIREVLNLSPLTERRLRKSITNKLLERKNQ